MFFPVFFCFNLLFCPFSLQFAAFWSWKLGLVYGVFILCILGVYLGVRSKNAETSGEAEAKKQKSREAREAKEA